MEASSGCWGAGRAKAMRWISCCGDSSGDARKGREKKRGIQKKGMEKLLRREKDRKKLTHAGYPGDTPAGRKRHWGELKVV